MVKSGEAQQSPEPVSGEQSSGYLDNLKPLGLGMVILVVVLAILFRIIGIKEVYEPSYLTLVLNTVFVFLPSLLIAIMTVRGFRQTGAWPVLWLGIGSLAFGIGTVLGGLLLALTTVNISVTVSNIIFFIGALLHFSGSFFVLSNVPDHRDAYPGRTAVILAVYLGVMVFIAGAALIGTREILPPFFLAGSGGTPLRQVLLAISIMLFLYSSLIFFVRYFRTKSPLIYWYALGLLLLSLSMAVLLMPEIIGSPMNWIGRIAQYLAGLYLLAAAMVALREAKVKNISTEESLANLLSMAQAELKRAEQRFSLVFQHAGIGIAISDMQGRVIESNPALENMLGYPKEELRNKAFPEFTHMDDIYLELPLFKDLTVGKREYYEIDKRYKCKDGSIIWVHVVRSIARGENGGIPFGISLVEDITERKKAEEALRDSEFRYRTVADMTYAFEFWLDPQGTYIYASPSSERICGIKNTEFIADPSIRRRIIHPDDLAAFDRHVSEEKKQIAGQIELRVRCRDGFFRWVAHVCQPIFDENGTFLGTRGSNRDITERKQWEEELRNSEEKYRTLFESIDEGFCIVEMVYGEDGKPVDYRFLVTNPAFERQTGLRDVRGKLVCSLAPALEQYWFDTYGRVALTGKPERFINEAKVLNRWYDVYAFKITEAGDKIVAILFNDITERMKTDRLKDEFIGMVSHELKTPLTVTMGALYTVRREGLSRDETHQLLQDAVSGAESLANIVENLLELSRYQANRLELHTKHTDIVKIARSVVQKLQKKSDIHRIKLDLPEALQTIKVDPLRLERILFNLVENAIKYSPKGGEVKIASRREKDELVVCVSDEGPGISAENQKKLFQSFEQLDIKDRSSIQGVGLGLKVCRTLVEAHGGRIWVESEPGKGANFCFTLLTRGGEILE